MARVTELESRCAEYRRLLGDLVRNRTTVVNDHDREPELAEFIADRSILRLLIGFVMVRSIDEDAHPAIALSSIIEVGLHVDAGRLFAELILGEVRQTEVVGGEH